MTGRTGTGFGARPRAVRQVGESGRAKEARDVLAALLEKISPEVVDPLLWRDVARVAPLQH